MATITMNAPTVDTAAHTHEHEAVEQEQEDWDWWYEWCDHNESSHAYLTLEMLNYLLLMDVKDLRCKAQKIIRANEPDRYCSRCPACNMATFDVWFAPSTLEVKHVECASALCTGQSYVDVPSGYVRSLAKFSKPMSSAAAPTECNKAVHTASASTTNPTGSVECVVKRKRGRPLVAKTKRVQKRVECCRSFIKPACIDHNRF